MRVMIFCLGVLCTALLFAHDVQHQWPEGQAGWSATDYSQLQARAGRVAFDLPSRGVGDLEIHADLPAFLDATANLEPLVHEDFAANVLLPNNGGTCYNPVDLRSDDPCFRPGDLAGGFQVRASLGSFSSSWLFLMDPGFLGTPGVVLGPNSINAPLPNPTRIDFPAGVTAVSMDAYEGVNGDPVAVTVYGTDGSVLGDFVVAPSAMNEPAFVGVTSPQPIGRVDLVGTTSGSGELIGDLRFGGGTGRLVSTPEAVDFGPVATGTTATVSVLLENTGGLPLELGSLGDVDAPFELSSDPCSGTILAPGADCELELAFAPQLAAADQAGLAIPVAGEVEPYQLAVHGQGVRAGLQAVPAALGLIAVVGSTSSDTVAIVNRSPVTATVDALALSGEAFGSGNGSCGVPPFELPPGDSCTLELTFGPDQAGERVGGVELLAADQSALARIHLNGQATGE